MRSRSGDTEAEVSQSLASRLFKSSTARCYENNLKLFKLEASSETGILSETNAVHCTFAAPNQFGQLANCHKSFILRLQIKDLKKVFRN